MSNWYTKIAGSLFYFRTRAFRRQLAIVAASFVAIAFLVAYHFASAQETQEAYQFSRDAQQGKAIAPVSLNLMGKNPELVYIGSYLVNAKLDCASCHTCPQYQGINPFAAGSPSLGTPPAPGPVNTANYLAGGVPFPGRGVTGTNLTPDSLGLPGGLTYEDFKSAMQNGSVSTKPGHVLQVHPWPEFRNLYENDLVSIYQYLSAIPPAQPGTCTGQGQNK